MSSDIFEVDANRAVFVKDLGRIVKGTNATRKSTEESHFQSTHSPAYAHTMLADGFVW